MAHVSWEARAHRRLSFLLFFSRNSALILLNIQKKLGLRVRVPLGPLPPTYVSYLLTSRNSEKPITDYVQLPLPVSSEVLPAYLFMDSTAPRDPHHWSDKDIPLTYWHLTYFKTQGLEYTCIGVTFSHGLFDGMGIAAVIHALEAESLGRPWSIPSSLEPGINENKMQTLIDATETKMREERTPLPADYRATSLVGLGFSLTFIKWHIWQQFWHKAQRRMILMPPQAYEKLVRDSREAMTQEGKTDVRLSTGDVIAAWIYKVCLLSSGFIIEPTNFFHRQFIHRRLLQIALCSSPTWPPSACSRTPV